MFMTAALLALGAVSAQPFPWPQPSVRVANVADSASLPVRLPAADPFDPPPAPDLPLGADPFDLPEEYVVAPTRRSLFATLWRDQVNYYSWETLAPSLAVYGFGAVLANTSLDQHFQNWWQEDVSTNSLYNVALDVKVLGEGMYVIPAFAGLWVAGEFLGDLPGARGAALWGGRTTRSILVGFPMMLVMQNVTGGSRPDDGEPNPSNWKFWQDNNGVSGHAFIGSIPFLTAAQLVENPLGKGALLAGSTLVGFSRIETNDHYLSQVMLGWWMGYIATAAVQRTSLENSFYSVEPMLMANGIGVGFKFRR